MTFSIQDLSLRAYVKAATTLAPLLTALSARAQEATGLGGLKCPDPETCFKSLEAMEKAGATPANMGRWMIDQVPALQDQATETAGSINSAAMAHDTAVHAFPWGSVAVVAGVTLAAVGVVWGIDHLFFKGKRQATSFVPKEKTAEAFVNFAKPLESDKFAVTEVAHIPVWQLREQINEGGEPHTDLYLRRMVIFMLSEHERPEHLGSLPTMLANRGFDVRIIGARGLIDPTRDLGKQSKPRGFFETFLKRRIPQVVTHLLDEATSHSYDDVVVIAQGGEANRQMHWTLKRLDNDRKDQVSQAIGISPVGRYARFHPEYRRGWTAPLQRLWDRLYGPKPRRSLEGEGAVYKANAIAADARSLLPRVLTSGSEGALRAQEKSFVRDLTTGHLREIGVSRVLISGTNDEVRAPHDDEFLREHLTGDEVSFRTVATGHLAATDAGAGNLELQDQVLKALGLPRPLEIAAGSALGALTALGGARAKG